MLDNEYVVSENSLISQNTIDQMRLAMRVPVAVKGALMADAHYCPGGIPVGGVWALKDAISPNAVGNDIACQVNMTIFDVDWNDVSRDDLINFLNRDTVFGYNVFKRDFSNNMFFNRDEWKESNYLRKNPIVRENAIKQFGSSGEGNHFASFGIYNEGKENKLALVTHWGSRKMGALIADYFHHLAVNECVGLEKEGQNLAWLDTNSEIGRDYVTCMNLAVDYATLSHNYIHSRALFNLNLDYELQVHSVHNFAAKENDLWVHRKGATPVSKGQLGIIPGSMATPTYIVEGLGNEDSLDSASHGAGRKMSRSAAKRNLSTDDMKKLLAAGNVTLIGAAIDESPEAYKDIDKVMAAQRDLVKAVGNFKTQITRMAE